MSAITAKTAKKDEFYTQYADIEKEMNAYLEFDADVFRDKTVLLPCDDPEWSNFTKYFAQNFEKIGLRKLISTSYAPTAGVMVQHPSLFETESSLFDADRSVVNGKIFTLSRDVNDDQKIDVNDLEWQYLAGDGDFRSDEVRALRDEADIIITNPPFSLFREFLAWILEAGKKFVILGNVNALAYKEVFPHIKAERMWLGPSITSGDREFQIPSTYPLAAATSRVDEDGNKFIRIKGVRWFTCLDHGRRHQPLALMTQADNKKFSKHKEVKGYGYERYDNYDAIVNAGRKRARRTVGNRARPDSNREEQMREMRAEGLTHQGIGDAFGITRERVRQILKSIGGPSATDARVVKIKSAADRRAEVQRRVEADLIRHPGSTVEEVADRTGLEVDEVRRSVPQHVKKLLVEESHVDLTVWSDAAIFSALRDAQTYEFPLTARTYASLVHRGEVVGPSVPLIGLRFRTWIAACELAGVEPGAAARDNYESRWTDSDLLRCVCDYLAEPDSTGSVNGYRKWASQRLDTPSHGTLRKRLGDWTSIKLAVFDGPWRERVGDGSSAVVLTGVGGTDA